jgi:nitroreductase
VANTKQLFKRVVPKGLYRSLKIRYRQYSVLLEANLDALRHIKFGAEEDDLFSGTGSTRNVECQLTKDYHRIEKGLALRNPKRPFGEAVKQRITSGLDVPAVASQLPLVAVHAQTALSALADWNDSEEIGAHVSPTVDAPLVWDPILNAESQALLEHFFSSRRSVRAFDSAREVNVEDIRKSVATAISTPSVCNRQAWRVHLFTQSDDVSRVIAHQNGNAGFGDTVPAVAVITVDTRLFAGANERHQRWIDGGLFAMSFAYGLHSRGLAACMLNWSMKNDASERLRASAGIAAYEDIVMLVAIGYTEKSFRIARSPRRPIDTVLELH